MKHMVIGSRMRPGLGLCSERGRRVFKSSTCVMFWAKLMIGSRIRSGFGLCIERGRRVLSVQESKLCDVLGKVDGW